ncbi:unnamed protein product [Urochloa decumbens]|uniref:F-box protein AT5G49610-like beta-propeller domain-containing protein n=1 Tax=Urochloa decumbens TaxID=240449 RepID=A0ABC9FPS3_9POAL
MSPSPRRPPAPPDLMDELVGEILLRIPPGEPAHLVHAALVCKPWLRIVLIRTFGPTDLVMWDPITDDQQHVPLPPYSSTNYTGAVICAVPGCDHLDCTSGPFLVVFGASTWASVYSSKTRGCSTRENADLSASTDVGLQYYIEAKPSVLIDDILYFKFEQEMGILKYDLARHSLTVVDVPEVDGQMGIVMAAEDGGLGFANIEGDDLQLWSWLTSDGSTVGWKLCRVIKLQSLLPYRNHWLSNKVIGFAEGTDIIFVDTEAGIFTLNIKLEKTRKVSERGYYHAVLPYMSFCAPVISATGYLPPP